MNSFYQCFDLSTFISEYAKAVQKPVVFIRSWGWNHGNDVDKINTSMQVYKQFLPTDIYLWMHGSEFIFIELENLEEAMEFFAENFPESQSETSPEMYMHYSIYNSIGQIVDSNE